METSHHGNREAKTTAVSSLKRNQLNGNETFPTIALAAESLFTEEKPIEWKLDTLLHPLPDI